MTRWTAADIPDQTGRTVVVTGANSGIGAITAAELARAGATVVLACRDTAKGEAAATTMQGKTEVMALDLSSLASVRSFAESLDREVDILVNNAGVMALPLRRTVDGFEAQIGTNHLGHFALTGLLLGRLRDRVVTVSSNAHRLGRLRTHDLNWERGSYQRWPAYGQSKLANLLFTFHLQQLLQVAGSPLRAVAAHPGYAATNLGYHTESFQDRVIGVTNRLLAQSAQMGALPTLYAATVPDLAGSSYVGPGGFMEQRGHPKLVAASAAAHNADSARILWELSQQLTGVTYDLAPRG